ncbi:MAG: 4Fe-4S dicluster domain-containing protein [Ignavibacteriales bacterium]|nr:4Fe-4S dicluster domain-containing protein [Ignavibacteriales bacterium]
MFLPKLREVKEALSSFFSKPYTTKFPMGPAYKPVATYRGFSRYDDNKCIGCGTCVQVCPAKAISLKDDKEKKLRIMTIDYKICMNCGQCEEKCITGDGIKLTTEYSFSTMNKNASEIFETVKKEIVVCEICGEVIGCVDHLKWIRYKLGAKVYAHPNQLLFIQKQFFNVEPSEAKSRVRREDYIKEVCPKCRYRVVVADEF